MLETEHLVAKDGFDTIENGPSRVWVNYLTPTAIPVSNLQLRFLSHWILRYSWIVFLQEKVRATSMVGSFSNCRKSSKIIESLSNTCSRDVGIPIHVLSLRFYQLQKENGRKKEKPSGSSSNPDSSFRIGISKGRSHEYVPNDINWYDSQNAHVFGP